MKQNTASYKVKQYLMFGGVGTALFLCVVIVPFLYGLYWKRATKAACWVSFAFSTVVMILNIFIRSSFPKMLQSPINAGAFCMIAGLVLVPIVSAFTKAPDKAHVDDVFACYERKVTVRAKEAIGDEEVQF